MLRGGCWLDVSNSCRGSLHDGGDPHGAGHEPGHKGDEGIKLQGHGHESKAHKTEEVHP